MMAWSGLFGRKPELPATPLEIPLFPLNAVLFPGGALGLKVFEQRYLDMAAACLRDRTPFGVCLIAEGQEVGTPALPHAVGTLAEIDAWDMPQLGILMLALRGGRRFRIRERRTEADGLLRASVEPFAEAVPKPVPETQRGLIALLERIVDDLGPEKMPLPHRFDDAEWVGFRLTEVLPVKLLAKQKLLELEDPAVRLEILYTFFSQRGLVK